MELRFLRKVKRIWELADVEPLPKKKKGMAVFIMPSKAEELIKSGKKISIDDVLI